MSEQLNQTQTDCITTEQLKLLLESNQPLTIIDVRTAEEYEALHIPGAKNIPEPLLAEASKEFTHDPLYITVCGKGGGRSALAAELLRNANLNAAALCGGTIAWFENT